MSKSRLYPISLVALLAHALAQSSQMTGRAESFSHGFSGTAARSSVSASTLGSTSNSASNSASHATSNSAGTSTSTAAKSSQNSAVNRIRPLYLSSIVAPPALAPSVMAPLPLPKNSESLVSFSKHYEQGLQFKKKGDLNHALIEFLQAIKENPRCTRAFYEQALIFRQKGYPKLAESALTQALSVDPSFREARILLAAVRLETGNTSGAATELTRSLGLSELPATTNLPPKSNSPTKTNLSATNVYATNMYATNLPAKTNSRNESQRPEHSPLPVSVEPIELKPITPGNGLLFQPDALPEKLADKASPPAARTHPSSPLTSHTAQLDTDEWAKKLKFLNEHGTGSLKSGEAFMFSEDTGEAVLFLSDGQRICRKICLPQNQHELVKNRRPDMLMPADLMYKLSTLGKLVSDPAAIVDMATRESGKDSGKETSRVTGRNLDRDGQDSDTRGSRHGSIGEIMDNAEDNRDNSFLNKAYLEDDGKQTKVDATTAHPLGTSPILKDAAGADATRGPGLDSTEPSALKDFSKDINKQSAMAVGDTIVEKTQKFVGWLKKTLHIP